MLRWITSPRESRESFESKDGACEGNEVMGELMLSEVETAVYEYECDEELRRSQVSQRVPDYTWLIADKKRPRKFLSIEERSQIQRACELVRAQEWNHVCTLWRSRKDKGPRSRENIIGCFIQSVQEVIGTRPRPQTVGSILGRYLRSQSSINAVADSPRDPSTSAPISARSLGPISFRSLDDIV